MTMLAITLILIGCLFITLAIVVLATVTSTRTAYTDSRILEIVNSPLMGLCTEYITEHLINLVERINDRLLVLIRKVVEHTLDFRHYINVILEVNL